jgi:hypothetical protein
MGFLVETACFGHGEPVVAGASRELRAALDFLTETATAEG